VTSVPLDPFHRVVLPRLLLVADGFAGGRDEMSGEQVRVRVRQAVEAGVAWVLLRDYGVADDDFAGAAFDLVAELRAIEPSLILSVGRHLELANALDAGVQTGRDGPSISEVREAIGPLHPVGYSAHDAGEAAAEAEAGADYILLGPVYQTTTHPGWPALGIEALSDAAQVAGPVPVFAIGGVTPALVPACRAAGAFGVAVLGGILDAPVERVGEYMRALRPP
jgi:thiamine-phosphate pyrophosphorylase